MATAANCSAVCQEFDELVGHFGIAGEAGILNRGFGSLKEKTPFIVRNKKSPVTTTQAETISAVVNLTIDSEGQCPDKRADNVTSSDNRPINISGPDLFDIGEVLFHSLFKNFELPCNDDHGRSGIADPGKKDSLLEHIEPSIPHKVVNVDKVIAAKAAGKDIGSVHGSEVICSENSKDTNNFAHVQVNSGKCSSEEIKSNESLETVSPSIPCKVLSLEELIAEKNILAGAVDLPSESDDKTIQTGKNTDSFQKEVTALSQDDIECKGPTSRRGLEKYFGRGAAHKRLSCYGDAASEDSILATAASNETSPEAFCGVGNQQPDLLTSYNKQSANLECNAPSELCDEKRIGLNTDSTMNNSQIYFPNINNLNSDSEEISQGRKKRQAAESRSNLMKQKYDSIHEKIRSNDMKRFRRNDRENGVLSNGKDAIRLMQQYEGDAVSNELVDDRNISSLGDTSLSSTQSIYTHAELLYNADLSTKRICTFPNQTNSQQQRDGALACGADTVVNTDDGSTAKAFQMHDRLESASSSGLLSLNQMSMAVSAPTSGWSHQHAHSRSPALKSPVTSTESAVFQSPLMPLPNLTTMPIFSHATPDSIPTNATTCTSFKIYPMLLLMQESSAEISTTQIAPKIQTTEASSGMQLISIKNPHNTLSSTTGNSNILLAIPIQNVNTSSTSGDAVNHELNTQNLRSYSTDSNFKVANPLLAPVKTSNKYSSTLSATSLLLSLAPKPMEVPGGQKQPLGQTFGVHPDSSAHNIPSLHGLPPCRVCGEKASGFHYGVNSCDPCNEFFRRTEKRNKTYRCLRDASCDVTGRARSLCNFCRFRKCLDVGMSRAKIKSGRYSHTKITQDTLEMKQSLVSPIMPLGAHEIESKINELTSLFTQYQTLDRSQLTGQCRPWKLQSFSQNHLDMFIQTYQQMVKRVPGFADLCPEDQTTLAKKSWMELWILSEIRDLACPSKLDLAAFDRQLWRDRFGQNVLEEVLRVARTILELNPSDNVLNLLKAVALTSSDFVALVDRTRLDQLNSMFVHCLHHELEKSQSTNRWPQRAKGDAYAALVSARVQMKCALRNCELVLSDSVHLQF